MRVLIDGSRVLNNLKAGIGNYTYELLRNLAFLKNSADYTVLVSGGSSLNLPPKIQQIQVNNSKRKYLPFDMERYSDKFDVYHEPNYIPRVFKGQKVVTVYDMSYRLFPQYHPFRRIAMLRFYEHRMQKADRIITVSNNSKEEIMDLLKIPGDRISVIYGGVSEAFVPMQIKDEQRTKMRSLYGIPEQYLLYVGTLEPRKNLMGLVKAYYQVRGELQTDVKLVLAGGKGWLYEGIFKTIHDLKLDDDVIFTGYVQDEHLPALYNMAFAFVYPSLYEGFGLPPLEAMACGVPVIVSEKSSLPEVVGNAGVLVDPNNLEELCNCMCRVISSVELRKDLSKKGLERASLFSWKKCAWETQKVYEHCD